MHIFSLLCIYIKLINDIYNFIETILQEYPSTTRSEIEKKIMIWFHHAGDRYKRNKDVPMASTSDGLTKSKD